MDLHNSRLHADAVSVLSQDQRISEIGWLALLACINSNEAKCVPYFLKKNIASEVHVNTDGGVEGLLHKFVHVLDGHCIYFVVHVDALRVFAVPFNHINELVYVMVGAKVHMSIVNFIFLENDAHHLLIYLCKLDSRIEKYASSLHDLQSDLWPFLINSNSD